MIQPIERIVIPGDKLDMDTSEPKKSRPFQFGLSQILWLFVLVALIFAFRHVFYWLYSLVLALYSMGSWQAFCSPFYSFYVVFGFAGSWPFETPYEFLWESRPAESPNGKDFVLCVCSAAGGIVCFLCWGMTLVLTVEVILGVLGLREWRDAKIDASIAAMDAADAAEDAEQAKGA